MKTLISDYVNKANRVTFLLQLLTYTLRKERCLLQYLTCTLLFVFAVESSVKKQIYFCSKLLSFRASHVVGKLLFLSKSIHLVVQISVSFSDREI